LFGPELSNAVPPDPARDAYQVDAAKMNAAFKALEEVCASVGLGVRSGIYVPVITNVSGITGVAVHRGRYWVSGPTNQETVRCQVIFGATNDGGGQCRISLPPNWPLIGGTFTNARQAGGALAGYLGTSGSELRGIVTAQVGQSGVFLNTDGAAVVFEHVVEFAYERVWS
jgi:hypothetical protein